MKAGFQPVAQLPGGVGAWGCTAFDNNCCAQAVDACPECFVAHCEKHMGENHDATCSRGVPGFWVANADLEYARLKTAKGLDSPSKPEAAKYGGRRSRYR